MGCGASKKKKGGSKEDGKDDSNSNQNGANGSGSGGAGGAEAVGGQGIDPATPRPVLTPGTQNMLEGAHPELPVLPVPIPQRAEPAEEPQGKHEWSVEGTWTRDTAGGCVNHATWVNNPQFLVRRPHGAATPPVKLDITMQIINKNGEVVTSQSDPVGMYFLRSDNVYRRFKAIGRSDVVARSDFEQVPEVRLLAVPLPETLHGGGTIIPCTFDQKVTGSFRLVVTADHDIVVTQHGTWHKTVQEFEWDQKTAGGCANYITWRENPQFQIQLKHTPTRAAIVLHKGEPREGGANGSGSRLHDDRDGKTKMGMIVIRSTVPGQKIHTLAKDDVIHKTSFSPNPQIALDLELSGPDPIVVLPSTFNPGILQSARLEIHTDHPIEITALQDPYKWQETTLKCEWKAGLDGGPITSVLTYQENPRVVLRPSRPGMATLGLLYLEQRDDGPNGLQMAGYYVYKLPQPPTDPIPVNLDPKHLVYRSTFQASTRVMTEAAVMVFDDESTYVIVPTTQLPNKHGEFKTCLYHYSSDPITLQAAPVYHAYALGGQWTSLLSGGCANHDTWTKNPSYEITVRQDTQLTILAQLDGQHRDAWMEDPDAPIPITLGMYLLTKPGQASTALAKSKYQAAIQVKMEGIQVEARQEPYRLTVTTFEPGQLGSFKLLVYATNEIAVKDVSM